MPVTIRAQRAADGDQVDAVLAAAFAGAPEVVDLEASLRARADSHGFVALDGDGDGDRVVGHVRLTRGWVDAEPRLVEVLVLSPLSVLPEWQRQGIGTALCAHAVREAEGLGAPAVFLEGSPRYYGRIGWQPASALGVTPPSDRIPLPAFQAMRFAAWEPWMHGALVYPEPFWAHDCVGLRGDTLAAVRRELEPPRSGDATRIQPAP